MPEPNTDDGRRGEAAGFIGHLSSLLAAKLAYLRARLELAGLEGREAAIHAAIILGLLIGGLIIAVFGYLFLILALVFLIAQVALGGGSAWIWVLASFALVHLAGAAFLFIVARMKLNAPLFSMTLEELKKDQEWLKTIAKPN